MVRKRDARVFDVTLITPCHTFSSAESSVDSTLDAEVHHLRKLLEEAEVRTSIVPLTKAANALVPKPGRKGMLLLTSTALLASGGAVVTAMGYTLARTARGFGEGKVEVWVLGEVGCVGREMGVFNDSDHGSREGMEVEMGEGYDVLPAELISGFITEDGAISSERVADRAVSKWF